MGENNSLHQLWVSVSSHSKREETNNNIQGHSRMAPEEFFIGWNSRRSSIGVERTDSKCFVDEEEVMTDFKDMHSCSQRQNETKDQKSQLYARLYMFLEYM